MSEEAKIMKCKYARNLNGLIDCMASDCDTTCTELAIAKCIKKKWSCCAHLRAAQMCPKGHNIKVFSAPRVEAYPCQ